MNEQEKQKYAAELNSEKVRIICDDHNYVPGGRVSMPMVAGCPNCCKAWFWYEFSKTPPHLREEKLYKLQDLIHHMIEDIEAGNWDFEFANGQVLSKDTDKKIILSE